MGLELLFLAFATLLVPLVFAGFMLAFFLAHRRGERLERAWHAYAAKRRLELIPASGAWPNRTSPLVRWTEELTAYRIETLGREAPRTCVSARPALAPLGEMVVTSAGEIDHELPAGFASTVMTAEVRRAFAAFGGACLSYAGGEIVLEWPLGEEDPARLDEARRVVARLVRAMRDAIGNAPYRAAIAAAR